LQKHFGRTKLAIQLLGQKSHLHRQTDLQTALCHGMAVKGAASGMHLEKKGQK